MMREKLKRTVARAAFEARIRAAWGQSADYVMEKTKWPQTEKEWRAYPHNPVAEVDLHLAAAEKMIDAMLDECIIVLGERYRMPLAAACLREEFGKESE